jgi:dethiobiotin synthetase
VKPLYVAGTGTDVGKTHVGCLLLRRARMRGRAVTALKPVLSGAPPFGEAEFASSDTARLLAAAGVEATRDAVERCSPFRYVAPLAPDQAAAREGRRLTLGEVVAATHDGLQAAPADAFALVEGAGGLMSPVAEDGLGLDWIAALGAPVLLVGGAYLGAISHTLTACAALAAGGAPLAGVVVNSGVGHAVEPQAAAAAIRRWTGAEVWELGHGEAGAEALDALWA